MKRKTWLLIIVAALILLVVISMFVIKSFFNPIKKFEGSIPYNQNNLYLPYDYNSLLEISGDGAITEYGIFLEDNKESIHKMDSFRVDYPIKKYISSKLFITEDDSILFGDIKETEQKKLGTVKNAADISIITDNEGTLTHTAVVTSDGLLFVQGDNSTGTLGIEAKQVNGEFVQVPNLKNVVKAVCGINCIFVLNTDGEVFLSGTLGDISYQTFTKLEVPEKVKNIEASDLSETLIALGIDGNVYEIGISFFVGDCYDIHGTSQKDIIFYPSFHIIPKLKNIVFISTPTLTAYAIDKNGNTFYWGSEMKGNSSKLTKVFKRIYGLPKYDKIWKSGYFYVLSGNEITAYSW